MNDNTVASYDTFRNLAEDKLKDYVSDVGFEGFISRTYASLVQDGQITIKMAKNQLEALSHAMDYAGLIGMMKPFKKNEPSQLETRVQ